MSSVGSRRNGSQASCEPCRKAKTRCDHQTPTCGRCRRRGPETRCLYIYHRAPHTPRRRSRETSSTHDDRSGPQASSTLAGAPHNEFTLSPFLVQHTYQRPPDPSRVSHDQKVRDEQLKVIIETLEPLRFLPLIQRLIKAYFDDSQVSLIPTPLILLVLSLLCKSTSIISTYVSEDTEQSDRTGNISQLAEDILRNSSTNINITPSLGVKSFCELYCGTNLRVETLGLLYALAARAVLYGTNPVEKKNDAFVQELLRCSDLSMRLARDVAPQINDVMLWHAFENMQLVSMTDGDVSPGVWRRLGDLATDIFATDLHRKTAASREVAPFFLAECRKKCYATSYQSDKAYASLFGRPPRIPKCYSDCELPLDLSDDQILADDPEAQVQAQRSLTADGWNTDEGFRSATWLRIRCILGEIREDIIQYNHGVVVSPEQIRDLLQQCHAKWASVPAHMRYSRDCWTSSISISAMFMMAKVYLSYLYTVMQLRRLLAKTDSSASSGLLQISDDILQTVIHVANARDRAVFMPRDISTVILAYGLPCATILATALQDSTRQPPRPLPPKLSHATLIRNLSIFISHLESVCGPQDVNYVFCAQASKALSRTLDDVLGSFATPSVVATPEVSTRPDPGERIMTPLSMPAASEATAAIDFETFDFEGLEEFDLAEWSTSVDWSTIGREWNIF